MFFPLCFSDSCAIDLSCMVLRCSLRLFILTFFVLSFLELKQIRKNNTKQKALKERQVSARAGADVDAQCVSDSVLISGAHPSPSSLPVPFPTLFPGALHSSCSHCSPQAEGEGAWGSVLGTRVPVHGRDILPLCWGGVSGKLRRYEGASNSSAWVNGDRQKV